MVVGFSLAGAAVAGKASAAAPTSAGYNPPLTQLDSWLRINADNTINLLDEPGRPGQRHLDRLPDGRRRGARRRHEPDDLRHVDERNGALNTQRLVRRRPHRRHRRLELDVEHRPPHPRRGRRRAGRAAQARVDEARRAGREPDGRQGRRLGRRRQVVTYGELVGGKLFNVTLNDDHRSSTASSPAKPVSAVQARRDAGAARRHPGEDPGQLRLQPQRSRCRACCTAAGSASARARG